MTASDLGKGTQDVIEGVRHIDVECVLAQVEFFKLKLAVTLARPRFETGILALDVV